MPDPVTPLTSHRAMESCDCQPCRDAKALGAALAKDGSWIALTRLIAASKATCIAIEKGRETLARLTDGSR